MAVRPNPRYVEPVQTPDPRAADGRKTVILHGKRVTPLSPAGRWPGAELWGIGRCNTFYWHQTLLDWTRWFDLHPVERTPHHKGIKVMRADAWAWYCRQDVGRPIYLLEQHPDCLASFAFPLRWVCQTLQTRRFTSSAELIIAFAMVSGFTRIVLNGIGTRTAQEFQYAHKGILYWIGRAEGAGVEVVIEGPSIYREPTHLYGYECAAPAWVVETDAPLVAADGRATADAALSGAAGAL
jgi:hypothetical protein